MGIYDDDKQTDESGFLIEKDGRKNESYESYQGQPSYQAGDAGASAPGQYGQSGWSGQVQGGQQTPDAASSQAAPQYYANPQGQGQGAQPTQPYPQMPYGGQPPYGQPQPPQQPQSPQSKGSWGWLVLGLFIPLVGLILFLVWRKTKPVSSKASGIGAIIGVVLNIIVSVVACVAIAPVITATTSLSDSSYSAPYNSSALSSSSATFADDADDNADDMDEIYGNDPDYIKIKGSDILPELGDISYWFEPDDCYWFNPDPKDGDWDFGYWGISDSDANMVEFWGIKNVESDSEHALVGQLPRQELLDRFKAAGWNGSVEIC